MSTAEGSNPELVYAWNGPPRLELWTFEVSRNGKTWKQHRFVADGGVPGVVIVAVHEGRFAMVEHFRPVAGRSFLEFPRGFGTQGGTGSVRAQAGRDAERELREETGLAGTGFTPLGNVWADTSLLQGSAVVVTAKLPSAAPVEAADGETDGLRWVPVEQFPQLAAAGEIADALSMAAYVHWLAAG
ncbi:NUDIX hydrolase [Arthrobacter sp. Sa2BUA2]|uniref:NUDIX hydrolase n=1 Tax=Arthrobacter pullicola TaxID=2762224 RepID=A0ABR8YHR7_9MICC|nr:NUDIX hydrolase [Arthrobacter pullicola]MBD8043757.1 NUDIX hydrolase [Arthrobacter pullicola]